MNGILCVNKPQDFTSFDVVAKLRGILKTKRIGHGGTLDPMATGVLPVFVGNAAKACDIMPDNTKSYRAGFRLGMVTDTQDITGEVLKSFDTAVTRDMLEAVIPEFIGDIMQLPPMYSAVRVNGKHLYDLARQGIEVERKARKIHVSAVNIISYSDETREGVMDIFCEKGTYIRTIINDIGEKLGCGGIMTSLVRTSSSGFSLEECLTLEEIQKAADSGNIEEKLISVERIFSGLVRLRLNEVQTRMYRNGVKLDIERVHNIREGVSEYTVYGSDGVFIGLAEADFTEGCLRVRKNFV